MGNSIHYWLFGRSGLLNLRVLTELWTLLLLYKAKNKIWLLPANLQKYFVLVSQDVTCRRTFFKYQMERTELKQIALHFCGGCWALEFVYSQIEKLLKCLRRCKVGDLCWNMLWMKVVDFILFLFLYTVCWLWISSDRFYIVLTKEWVLYIFFISFPILQLEHIIKMEKEKIDKIVVLIYKLI